MISETPGCVEFFARLLLVTLFVVGLGLGLAAVWP